MAPHGLTGEHMSETPSEDGVESIGWLWRATVVMAATLCGLGTIFWLAANWAALGRITQFSLLQALMIASGGAALWRPAWRTPAALLLFLLSGGLLAHVGQTYQTGADPWQLFALWAALGLPMAWGARHDATWSAWTVVTMTALSLWVAAHTERTWLASDGEAATHLLAWAGSGLIGMGLSAPTRPWTGAGPWSQRLALTLFTITVTGTAVANLLVDDGSRLYGLGLLTLVAGAALLSRPRWFDLHGLSAMTLGLNVCVVSGLGRWLLEDTRGDAIGAWLLLGLLAAGLLAASVKLVMRMARANGRLA